MRIRKAHSVDAEALTAIAHAAKRYWRYPEEYIRLWKDDLTVTTDFVDQNTVYCAEEGSKFVGF